MFLSEPGRTDYDINFDLFGFPIRTHPAFFITPILLGRGLLSMAPNLNTGVGWLLLIAIFWVSILVHELGHAIAFRYFGLPCRIVMYWMGGLAIPDSGNVWSPQRSRGLTSNQQIVVSLAGPVFGFLLAAALCGIVYLVGGSITVVRPNIIPFPVLDLRETILAGKSALLLVIWGGILLNIFLNILNLIPIYPLDGGQATRHLMMQMDPQMGLRNSIILSIAAGVIVAVFAFKSGDQFIGFFFGFMAWSNFQTLQQFGGRPW